MDVFTIEVDGTKTIPQLVQDCQFDQPTDRVNNFTPTNTSKRTAKVKIFTFPVYKTTKEVFEKMQEEKFKPATIEELLAFGKVFGYLYKQKNGGVGCTVALGSSAKDVNTECECFASLHYTIDSLLGFSGKQDTVLSIEWNRPQQAWHPSYYFLGTEE